METNPTIKQPYPMPPGARLDFSWSWTAWLAEGEAIVSHDITVGGGLTLETHNAAGGVVTAWLRSAANAAIGLQTSALCSITTSAGRIDSRAITIMAKPR